MATIIQNANGYTHLSTGKYTGVDNPMSIRSSSRPTSVQFDTSSLFPRVEIPDWTGDSTIHVNIGDMNSD